uniref:Uncharacterized protein n=1 Tax=Physcomitrium patens TaxID=3218 RepID=A0A2K1KHT6_PHYPA|nr:hypothetical protein PHYPA_007036 [Physcomitrium patens]
MQQGLALTLPKGVCSKADDGDSTCTFDIDYVVAAATVHDGSIAVASVLIARTRDADEGIQMVGSKRAMAGGRERG